MATFAEASQELLTVVRDTLTANGVSDDDLVLRNEVFDGEVTQTWYLVSVHHKKGEQKTLGPVGSRRFMYSGEVRVAVHSPLNAGSAPSANVVDFFRDVAGTRLSSDVEVRAPVMDEGRRAGPWYVSTMTLPFVYEQVQ